MRIASIVYCTLFIMVNSRKIQRRTKGKHRGIEFAKKRITNARGAGSCSGEDACYYSTSSIIGDNSCDGYGACVYSTGDIGDNSCIGIYACADSTSSIGEYSCIDQHACEWSTSNIGDNSCRGHASCHRAHATIGSNSCLGQDSCKSAYGTIGSNSCIADYSCDDYMGVIPSNCPSVQAMDAGHCIHLYTVGMNPTDALGQCEGDCDYDDDCLTGLVCHHRHVPTFFYRDGTSEIPGCLGTGHTNYDYCTSA